MTESNKSIKENTNSEIITSDENKSANEMKFTSVRDLINLFAQKQANTSERNKKSYEKLDLSSKLEENDESRTDSDTPKRSLNVLKNICFFEGKPYVPNYESKEGHLFDKNECENLIISLPANYHEFSSADLAFFIISDLKKAIEDDLSNDSIKAAHSIVNELYVLQSKENESNLKEVMEVLDFPRAEEFIKKATDLSAKEFIIFHLNKMTDFDFNILGGEIDILKEIIQKRKTQLIEMIESIDEYDACIFLFHARLLCTNIFVSDFRFQSLIAAIASYFPEFSNRTCINNIDDETEGDINLKSIDISLVGVPSSIEYATRKYFRKIDDTIHESIQKYQEKIEKIDASTSQEEIDEMKRILDNLKEKRWNLEEILVFLTVSNVDVENFELERYEHLETKCIKVPTDFQGSNLQYYVYKSMNITSEEEEHLKITQEQQEERYKNSIEMFGKTESSDLNCSISNGSEISKGGSSKLTDPSLQPNNIISPKNTNSSELNPNFTKNDSSIFNEKNGDENHRNSSLSTSIGNRRSFHSKKNKKTSFEKHSGDKNLPAKKCIKLSLRYNEKLYLYSKIETFSFYRENAEVSDLKKMLKKEEEGNFYLLYKTNKDKYILYYKGAKNKINSIEILEAINKTVSLEGFPYEFNSIQELLLNQI